MRLAYDAGQRLEQRARKRHHPLSLIGPPVPGQGDRPHRDRPLEYRAGLAYDRARTAIGNGLPSAAHQDHRRQRLILQPAFRREHLHGYVAVICREITATMQTWHDGDRIDLVDEMFTLTTTVALRTLFRPNACAAPSTPCCAASTPGRWSLAGRLPTPVTTGTHEPGAG